MLMGTQTIRPHIQRMIASFLLRLLKKTAPFSTPSSDFPARRKAGRVPDRIEIAGGPETSRKDEIRGGRANLDCRNAATLSAQGVGRWVSVLEQRGEYHA